MDEYALYLAGGIGSYILQWLKNQLDIDGVAAFWLVIIVSIVIALISFFVTGDGFALENLLGDVAKVMTAAGVVYNFFIAEHGSQ